MRALKLFTGILFLLIGQFSFAFDNVLLISVDTLRADYLGCYGSKKAATPNIDALARSGVVFRNAVAPTPFTLPSHTSLLTGLIPPIHQVQDNAGFYLDDRIQTLAEALKSQGVSTAAFVAALPLDSRFRLNQGFDVYDDSYPTVSSVSGISMPERRADEVIDAALKWLEIRKNQRWFAFIHLYDPHAPYDPPAPFNTKHANDLYAGEVAYVDQQVARLFSFLKQNRIDEKTLIVFTSDHGESLGEHEEKTHGVFAYESTLRIPLIVSPFAAQTIEPRVRLIDVAPTILDIQKLPVLRNIQGTSFRKALETNSNATIPLNDSYFESLSMHFNAGWAPLRGFYSSHYKFIDLPLPELYDLNKDPGETQNLCADTKLCRNWAGKFLAYFRPFTGNTAEPAPVDAETREQLQALGYVAGAPVPAKNEYGPDDDPKNLIATHNRVGDAVTLFNNGQDQHALEILMEIIAEKPRYSDAYFHASFIRNAQGTPEKSVELLGLAKKNGLGGPEISGKLGLYLYEAGKYADAIRELKQAIHERPYDMDNLNYLGMSYSASGQFDLAEKTFLRAREVDPSDAMTMSNLGTLYFTQGNGSQAKKHFQQAVDLNPNLVEAWSGLGAIYAQDKNWNLAIFHWNRALQMSDRNFDIMLSLALAYLKTGQNDEALGLLLQFEKTAPEPRYSSALIEVRKLIGRLQK